MKRYIHSATLPKQNAKTVAAELQKEMERDGFANLRVFTERGKPGTSGASIRLTYRYHLDEDYKDYLFSEYAENYGMESAENTYKGAEADYNNFLLLCDMVGEDIGEESDHDPFRHRGGGYQKLHEFIKTYAQEKLNQICPEAFLDFRFGGLWGIETNANIKVYVPKT